MTTNTKSASQIDARLVAFRLQEAGHVILRYGLVFILLMIGLQKWTKTETEAIQPWIAHSPFLSWLYQVTSIQGAYMAIGASELIIAAQIAVRRWAPRLTVVGSAGAILMFLTTLSLLVTTPNRTRRTRLPDQGLIPAWRGGLEHR